MNSQKNQKKSVRVNLLDVETAGLPENIEEDVRKAVLLAFESEGGDAVIRNSSHFAQEASAKCGSPPAQRGALRSFQVSVVLTSDREMAALNKRYLDKNSPTDVLSFPYSTGKFTSADIFISTGRAREQAKDYCHTYREEIIFLVLHGVFHLLGYNDRDDSGRKRMWRRQEEILKKL